MQKNQILIQFMKDGLTSLVIFGLLSGVLYLVFWAVGMNITWRNSIYIYEPAKRSSWDVWWWALDNVVTSPFIFGVILIMFISGGINGQFVGNISSQRSWGILALKSATVTMLISSLVSVIAVFGFSIVGLSFDHNFHHSVNELLIWSYSKFTEILHLAAQSVGAFITFLVVFSVYLFFPVLTTVGIGLLLWLCTAAIINHQKRLHRIILSSILGSMIAYIFVTMLFLMFAAGS